jgi:hypothetical protein
MTDPEAEYGERLRRALHAAADSVAPSGDGLERIRSRIAHERAPDSFVLFIGWLRSVVSDARAGLPDLRPVVTALRSLPPAIKSALLPAIKSVLLAIASITVTLWSSGRDRLRTGDGWMRLVFATAGAVFIVAAATILAVPGLRQSVGVTVGLTSPNPPAKPPGGVNVPTANPIATGSATPTAPQQRQPGGVQQQIHTPSPTATPSCTGTETPAAGHSLTPTPHPCTQKNNQRVAASKTPSPSPSKSATPTATPTTPTPTLTPTLTPTPSVSQAIQNAGTPAAPDTPASPG